MDVMENPFLAGKDILKPYVCDANEAVKFKLIRTVKDIEIDDMAFKPEMSHQIFGDGESIFGYKDLSVNIYCTAGWLTTYVGISYEETINSINFDGIEADNILEKLSEVLQPGFIENIDLFVESLNKEHTFKPYGNLLNTFAIDENNEKHMYEIHHCNTSMEKYLNYHQRLQPFVLWYIDGANYIDVDDEKWQFFLLYEKYSTEEHKNLFSIAGFATVYEYYAYPKNIRPRISQLLILPPYQRKGLCTYLINSIYDFYLKNDSVIDITVEDPNEEFQQVRDFVDICRCEKLECFSHDKLFSGFTHEMVDEARKTSKINRKQARRIYEILRLKNTNINNEKEYKAYRLCVKRRLNAPFHKEQEYMKKLGEILDMEEFQAAVKLDSLAQRFEKLETQYKELEEQYLRVIRRCERVRDN